MARYLLHDFIIEKYIKQALEEDIGFGDISTDFIAGENDTLRGVFNSRSEGIVCGVDIVKMVFKILDPDVKVTILKTDGEKIKKGDDIAIVEGNARYILTGERTALNYIQRMSGIATLTHKYQEAIKPYSASIVDTRKTTPNFRMFEKYAVKIGGSSLHRFNLSDCVMLKDNHIKLAGNITEAVQRVRKHISHAHKIEVETDNLEQVDEAIKAGADIIMLDNMDSDTIKKALKIINGKAIVEASGNINLNNINEIASTGVDIISSSAIVAKASTLDIGLDM